jgi:hypothetical protein
MRFSREYPSKAPVKAKIFPQPQCGHDSKKIW